jgi:hypothetical protein
MSYEGTCPGAAADALLGATTFHLADKNRDGLLLHAAAVALNGRCLLLPGKTGAGKTTLAAWLVKKGFVYLTDELVYIGPGSQIVNALRRPLNIKKGALPVVQALGTDVHAPQTLSNPASTLVPHALLGDHKDSSAPPLVALLFPHHRHGTRFRVEPLSSGQAAMGLIECLINARNLPEHGVPEIARLARGVKACRMRYANFEQIEEWMSRLMASNLTTFERRPIRPEASPDDRLSAHLNLKLKIR